MFQYRRCLQVLGAGAVISLLVLLSRELIISGKSQRQPYYRLVSYLNEQLDNLRGRPHKETNFSATIASVPLPTTKTLPAASNKSLNIILYPKLFSQLKPVPGTVSFAAAANAAAVTSTPTICQRPKPEIMVHYLQENRTSPLANASLADGGFWTPKDCSTPLSRTAVIVPYRNRSENLDVFVPYMHRFLKRQKILFTIFVVEQTDSRLFNRAKLLNIGFQLSQRFFPFDCFVFHDCDKVPEDAANLYDCANAPKLMISEMRGQDSAKYHKGKLYHNFFGGVSAVTKDIFLKANGNSNRYYGWGREDDELAARLSASGFRIHYTSGSVGRYINLQHGNDVVVNKMPWPYGSKVRQTMGSDGLNSLNYTGLSIHLHPLFVLIRAEV